MLEECLQESHVDPLIRVDSEEECIVGLLGTTRAAAPVDKHLSVSRPYCYVSALAHWPKHRSHIEGKSAIQHSRYACHGFAEYKKQL
jgi:hypothetical protein